MDSVTRRQVGRNSRGRAAAPKRARRPDRQTITPANATVSPIKVAMNALPLAGPRPPPESGRPTTPPPGGVGVPGGWLVPRTPEVDVAPGVPGVDVAPPGVDVGPPGVDVGPPGVDVGPPGVDVTEGVGVVGLTTVAQTAFVTRPLTPLSTHGLVGVGVLPT